MRYKANHARVIERMSGLYAGEARDRIFACFQTPGAVIRDYAAGFADGQGCRYPDMNARIAFWDALARERMGLFDDSLPMAYLSELDQGLYAAVTGAKIGFNFEPETGWISSMSYPLGLPPEKIRPAFDGDSIWYRRYHEQMRIFKEGAADNFGISHFIMINGLNFLFELRGATDAYYDVIYNPAFAGRIMDFALELNLRIQDDYFERVGLHEGGTVSNMGVWIPGRVVSESVDPFHLASPDFFEQWGRPYAQGAFDRYDGGVLHLHTNGHHLLEHVATLRGLKLIMLLEERTAPPPWQKAGELSQRAGNVPLAFYIPFDAFVKGMDGRSLPGNALYHVTGAPDTAAANDAMAKALDYRA